MAQLTLPTYAGRLDIERMFNAAQNISFDGQQSGQCYFCESVIDLNERYLCVCLCVVDRKLFDLHVISRLPRFVSSAENRVQFSWGPRHMEMLAP